MIFEKNSLFWADSELVKIEIVYDKIVISIFNDALQKMVYISCYECVGMTELIVWDEVIIDNIYVNTVEASDNQMLSKVISIYGDINQYGKPIGKDFIRLDIALLDQISFSVICKDVCISDEVNRKTGDGSVCSDES